jgi:hypothetical protein
MAERLLRPERATFHRLWLRVLVVTAAAGVGVACATAAVRFTSPPGPIVPGPTAAAASPPSIPGPSTGIPSSASPSPTTTSKASLEWKSVLRTGPWSAPHVQGVAVDQERGYIYYSFTSLLVKTDLSGKMIGTVQGFTGHLGDLDFNPADGRVYGSLEYKRAKAFYIAIFDVDRITRVGMRAQDSTIVSTVYLPEVVSDFTADLDGNGVFAGDTANTRDHRYGCSGIDGLAFGPRFGSTDGPNYLTVAYGIYGNTARTDNDHQVLLQYDTSEWSTYERPLTQSSPHRDGPAHPSGKYFVYTGNTRFGVQSLEYDPWDERWLLSVYPGSKRRFPNYTLFAVSAESAPKLEKLTGLHGEKGLELPLADDGLEDPATGIRGWRQNLPFGIQSLGHGKYYIASSASSGNRSSATLNLESWTGNRVRPFRIVRG